MEELIRKVVPSEINDMNIDIETFIELYNRFLSIEKSA